MNSTAASPQPNLGGISFHSPEIATVRRDFLQRLDALGLDHCLQAVLIEGGIRFHLLEEYARQWVPGGNTLQLAERMGLDVVGLDTAARTANLQREIVVAMLACPEPLDFPDAEEFESALRMRAAIAEAARKTALAFDTVNAERPDCWTYSEVTGFVVLPGVPLADALLRTTQPGATGMRYSFSCYRATEYVMLLAIAQELARCNPALASRLQQRWQRRAIMSSEFHDTFLREYGSVAAPLPASYYVPGDRVWFRNPDPHSSDVAGYEGSWVLYLGNGRFGNFWNSDRPFTLTEKMVEMFHWRDGARKHEDGTPYIDERAVVDCVQATMQDPSRIDGIVDTMMRYRDPQGVYADGGCLDMSREHPRWVWPRTSDIAIADA